MRRQSKEGSGCGRLLAEVRGLVRRGKKVGRVQATATSVNSFSRRIGIIRGRVMVMLPPLLCVWVWRTTPLCVSVNKGHHLSVHLLLTPLQTQTYPQHVQELTLARVCASSSWEHHRCRAHASVGDWRTCVWW